MSPRPYSFHVAEQLSREASMSVDTAVEDSLAARYLSAAHGGEVQRAEQFARRIRAGSETQAIVEVMKEQRGSNYDLLVLAAAQGASYMVGKVIGSVSPHPALTAAPAIAGYVASLLLPVHFAVRAGIGSAAASYIAGAISKK